MKSRNKSCFVMLKENVLFRKSLRNRSRLRLIDKIVSRWTIRCMINSSKSTESFSRSEKKRSKNK